MSALGDGRTLLREPAQRLTYGRAALLRAASQDLMRRRLRLKKLEAGLTATHPKVRLQKSQHALHRTQERLQWLWRQRLLASRHRLSTAAQRLNAMSPLAVLDRGYSIALRQDGSAVRDAQTVQAGARLQIHVARGIIHATVE